MVLVYKDLITGHDYFSDANRPEDEGNGAMVILKTGYKAIEGTEYYGPGTPEYADGQNEKVLEMVHKGNLAIMDPKPKKADFMKKILKPYIKKLKKALPQEQKADFVKVGGAYVATIMKKYKQLEVLSAPFSSDGKIGMSPLLEYSPDGMNATIYFWKHGMITEKY